MYVVKFTDRFDNYTYYLGTQSLITSNENIAAKWSNKDFATLALVNFLMRGGFHCNYQNFEVTELERIGDRHWSA